MKGWWLVADPVTRPGDTTAWYASFWEFCARYGMARFGREWYLSPLNSLLLLAEATEVPRQVVLHAPAGTNNSLDLPFETGLYDLKSTMPRAGAVTERGGLNLLVAENALCTVAPNFFERYPVEAQTALASIPDPSALEAVLLEGGNSVVAGRLAGAFRRVDRGDVADDIIAVMKHADYDVRESDPFDGEVHIRAAKSGSPPIAARMAGLWEAMREAVLRVLPPAPGPVQDPDAYLRDVDEVYASDAYHSLSIEGYVVSGELIERVRAGVWSPDADQRDARNRDALAARGYYQAFERAKSALGQVFAGSDAADVVRRAHRDWYRELFQPAVSVGLMAAEDLAGYRNRPVFIQGSRHVPPRVEAVRDAMSTLFDLLHTEPAPAVRAVLGHWMYGYIHPNPDGNGRLARFLMNVMLASGGYRWTVIPVDARPVYMQALERASIEGDAEPFAELIRGLLDSPPPPAH